MIRRYEPYKFLKEYPVGTLKRFSPQTYIPYKISRFRYKRMLKSFLNYFKYFVNIAYESEIKISSPEHTKKQKYFVFKCHPFEFRLRVTFDTEIIEADNKFGMDRKFVINGLALEVSEYVSNIEVKYARLFVDDRYKKIFMKFLKKIRKFIQKNDRMNVWFIFQGINVQNMLGDFDL